MDFSAANTSLWNFIIQLGIICGAILISNLLRQRVPFIRGSMIPTAVLAGFILLILRATGALELDAELLETLVYHGIALGFIAMSLRVADSSKSEEKNLTGPKSGALIVGAYLAQGVVGLAITLGLAYTVMPGLFKAAGLLLPMGYGQGPGQANNVGSTYEALGFEGGRSFGLAIAAAGYLCACIVGVIMLNVLAKKGAFTSRKAPGGEDDTALSDYRQQNEIPVSDSIDKFSVQVAMVLVIYLVTFLVTWGITLALESFAPGLAKTLGALLWGFNFIIGAALAILTKTLLSKLKRANLMTHQYQNNYLLSRISGFFFDLMIVAGIASINLEELSGLWLPFALMAVAGGVVTWFYLKWVCKKIYPGYYYEGLMSMYGMMTGTISSGVLLLREIDPEFKTPAANNLVLGSSFGIIFGAPVLALVGLAPGSDAMCWLTLALAALYFALLMLFIFKVNRKGAAKAGGETDGKP